MRVMMSSAMIVGFLSGGTYNSPYCSYSPRMLWVEKMERAEMVDVRFNHDLVGAVTRSCFSTSVHGGFRREKVNGRFCFHTNSVAQTRQMTPPATLAPMMPIWVCVRPIFGLGMECERVMRAGMLAGALVEHVWVEEAGCGPRASGM